ncbi:MAG: glycosyltransferase family 2 protein, partial [Steroidobacteraceae bacterium]
MSLTNPAISVVLPVLNERDNLEQLHKELTGVLTTLGRDYELVFVDDGSTDGSTELCRELVRRDPRVVLVELRRRFGKATALQAGFGTARGDIIFTMDADLQDDPKEIPRFLDGFEQGFDLMCGWKEDRKDSLSKTLPSKLFNYVTSRTSGLKLRDFNCGFKAYKREVVQGLHLYGELYR